MISWWSSSGSRWTSLIRVLLSSAKSRSWSSCFCRSDIISSTRFAAFCASSTGNSEDSDVTVPFTDSAMTSLAGKHRRQQNPLSGLCSARWKKIRVPFKFLFWKIRLHQNNFGEICKKKKRKLLKRYILGKRYNIPLNFIFYSWNTYFIVEILYILK